MAPTLHQCAIVQPDDLIRTQCLLCAKDFHIYCLTPHDFIGQEMNAHLLNHIITSRKGFFSLGPVDI